MGDEQKKYSAEEQRKMLDDPNVSKENKKALLNSLAASGDLSDNDKWKYSQELGINPLEMMNLGEHGGIIPMDEMMGQAAAASAEQQIKKAETDKALGDSWKRLGEGGFSNSDEIIDQGDVGLKIFDEFHPRFTKAGGQSQQGGGDARMGGLDPNSLRAATAEFRGIDFTAFRADADALTQSGKTVTESNQQLDQAWGNNLSGWQGGAATAANQYKSKLDAGSATLAGALTNAPGTITTGINTIEKQVTDFAKLCHNKWGDGKMAGMTPSDVDAVIEGKEKLPGVISELKNKIHELENRSLLEKGLDLLGNIAAGALGFLVGGPIGAIAAVAGLNFAKEINEDNIKEECAKYEKALTDCETKIEQFKTAYTTKANEVHDQATSAKQGIQQSYDTMVQGLGKGLEQDPFAQVGSPNLSGGEEKKPGGGPGTGGGGPGTGGGGPGTGGGGPGAGGGTPPAGAEEPKKPEEGMNPVTGKPLETDPETGKPYPIDPETGEAIKDAGDEQDTMTVQKGDDKITMSEPDKDGKMEISVDDGKGQPKDYKLDFGDGEAGKEGEDGKPGDPAKEGDKDFGPQGSQQDTGEKVYKPGPDGKIHIEDGNLKITAERPEGPDGPTVVTVDDGTGEPTSYTLDEEGSKDGEGKDGAGEDGKSDLKDDDLKLDDRRSGDLPTDDLATGEPEAATGGETLEAESKPAGSDGFQAPGGVDAGGDGAAGAPAAAADAGAPADAAPAADPAAQQTAPAEAATADSGPIAHAGGAPAGGVPLGDTGSLDPGSQTGGGAPAPAMAGAAPGLGAAPGMDPSAAATQQGAAAGGGMGGMPMMGGMGGAGGGGGGDQERGSSQYRVDGGIFETSSAGGRISGSLDDDGDRSIRYDR
ncbi:WXG100 family type VII secretion target [Amycolatopsis nigrescens]|uniref:WXG100 family type VII secretion target n=1 Tax=Amycolatopsis nigrescens TaxID=381445 RepID=UPI00036812AC|nr:hypothetical protein [Amycolatopsis nigrescens]